MDSRRTTATDSLRSSRSVACSCCAPLRGTWRAFDSWLITRVAILGVKITFYPGMRRSLFFTPALLAAFFIFFFCIPRYLLRPSFKQSGLPFYNTLWFLGLRGSDACTECHSHTGIRVRNTTLLVSPLGWKGTVPRIYTTRYRKRKQKNYSKLSKRPYPKEKKNSHHKPGQPLQKYFHQKEPLDDESNFMACDSARFWLEIVENAGWKNFGM
jgi:hypothetical protein